MANFLDDFSKAFEPSFRQGLAISPQFERLRIEREKLQTEEAQQAAALSAQGMIASVESAGQQWLADRMGERSQEFMAVNEAERVSRMAKAGATEKQIMDKLASFLPETDEATLSFMATVAKKNTDEFDNAVKHMFTRVAGGNPPDVTNLDNIVDFFSEVRGQKPPEVDMPRIKMEDQLRLNQFKQKQVALALDSLSDNPDVFGIHIGAMREYMGELSKEGLELVKTLETQERSDARELQGIKSRESIAAQDRAARSALDDINQQRKILDDALASGLLTEDEYKRRVLGLTEKKGLLGDAQIQVTPEGVSVFPNATTAGEQRQIEETRTFQSHLPAFITSMENIDRAFSENPGGVTAGGPISRTITGFVSSSREMLRAMRGSVKDAGPDRVVAPETLASEQDLDSEFKRIGQKFGMDGLVDLAAASFEFKRNFYALAYGTMITIYGQEGRALSDNDIKNAFSIIGADINSPEVFVKNWPRIKKDIVFQLTQKSTVLKPGAINEEARRRLNALSGEAEPKPSSKKTTQGKKMGPPIIY